MVMTESDVNCQLVQETEAQAVLEASAHSETQKDNQSQQAATLMASKTHCKPHLSRAPTPKFHPPSVFEV